MKYPHALGSLAVACLLPVFLSRADGPQTHRPPESLDVCAEGVEDQAGTGCLQASGKPTSGLLFPYPGSNNAFEGPAGVSGGTNNEATGLYAFVGGGRSAIASGRTATATGGVAARALGRASTVAGGSLNQATEPSATISGGRGNNGYNSLGTIRGGVLGFAGVSATLGGGGSGNYAGGVESTVSGGFGNRARGQESTIGGGGGNRGGGYCPTVAGGGGNTAYYCATACGGFNQFATVRGAAVGGRGNQATWYSFAAGQGGSATHDFSFVWADSAPGPKDSSAERQFSVFASGGTRIFSNGDATAGAVLAPGAGSWSTASDRNAKENLIALDGLPILDRLASVPISTWNYPGQGSSVRHMGPMAQDLWKALGLGLGDKTIDSVDSDGVILAAIQELRREKDTALAVHAAKLAELRRANIQLRKELDVLVAQMSAFAY